MQVGIDMIGPLPLTKKGNRYIVTLVDYFSKWPEAAPLPDKTAPGVALFLYELFCRLVSNISRRELPRGVIRIRGESFTPRQKCSGSHPRPGVSDRESFTPRHQ